MQADFTRAEREKIKDNIRDKYAKVSVSPEGLFMYPTGRPGLAALKYDREIVQSLPDMAVDSYCGVGNPFSLGPIHEGDSVLDIGCGGGVDTMMAASMVGPTGRVVGIDMSPEMIARARRNLPDTGLENVSFQRAGAENLPFPGQSFDVVISNGTFNLIPDKGKALEEVFRVLKPGGRLMMADQFLAGDLLKDPKAKIGNWANWEGGSVPGRSFLEMIEQGGGEKAELIAETGFNSSQVTRGALVRASKSTAGKAQENGASLPTLDKYREFFNAAYVDGELDGKTKLLIALGASLAAGCDPWTRYCLAGARQQGATDQELQETMEVAMTVGATRIQVLQESCLAGLAEVQIPSDQSDHQATLSASQAECGTWSK